MRRLQTRLSGEGAKASYADHQAIFNMLMTREDKDIDEFLYNHLTAGYRAALPELIKKYPTYFAL